LLLLVVLLVLKVLLLVLKLLVLLVVQKIGRWLCDWRVVSRIRRQTWTLLGK
jgi:hypothetical protein